MKTIFKLAAAVVLASAPILTQAQSTVHISGLPPASVPLTGAETVVLNQAGTTCTVTASNLLAQTYTNAIIVGSSGYVFTNLWLASDNCNPAGDVVYVFPGNYFEGTNVCGFPKNVTVLPLGTANITLASSNLGGILGSSNIYILPTDNMRIYRGLVISQTTKGQYNSVFGTATNTPSATNWTVEFDYQNADSDGIYWHGTNNYAGTVQNSTLKGFWDTFAAINTSASNHLVFNNVIFDTGNTNQPDPSQKRPVNIQGDGIYIFNNCTFRCKHRLGSATVWGIQWSWTSGEAIANSCTFDIATGYDTYNGGGLTNLVLNGCIEMNGNTITFDPGQGTYGAFPGTFQSVAIPAFDGVDNISAGTWNLQGDNSQAANLVLSTQNNPFGATANITFRNFNWDGNSGNGGIFSSNIWGNVITTAITNYGGYKYGTNVPAYPHWTNHILTWTDHL